MPSLSLVMPRRRRRDLQVLKRHHPKSRRSGNLSTPDQGRLCARSGPDQSRFIQVDSAWVYDDILKFIITKTIITITITIIHFLCIALNTIFPIQLEVLCISADSTKYKTIMDKTIKGGIYTIKQYKK